MRSRIISTLLVETDAAESNWIRRSLNSSSRRQTVNAMQWKLHRAPTLDSAIKLLSKQKFDIILIGLRSSRKNIQQRLQQLRQIAPRIPVIAVVDIEDHRILDTACALIATNPTLHRQPNLKAALSAIVLPGHPTTNGLDIQKLTPREHQVFQLIAEGRSTKQVAEHLDIAVKTAETHRTNLMRKLNLRSVSQLVRYAIRHEIVEA